MAGVERLQSDRRVIAAPAALFWKWTDPVRLWPDQKPSQRTAEEGVTEWPPLPDWALKRIGEEGAGE